MCQCHALKLCDEEHDTSVECPVQDKVDQAEAYLQALRNDDPDEYEVASDDAVSIAY